MHTPLIHPKQLSRLARVVGLLTGLGVLAGTPTTSLHLHLRDRVRLPDGAWQERLREVDWHARQTAVIVCDMWDRHWCRGATARVAEMAPRMNRFLKAARARGALIIHAPSDTMDYYRDTPQRRLAQAAPPVEPEVPLRNWCHLDREREGQLPIDDSDGGCDDQPRCREQRAWTHQIDTLEIFPGDAITDSAEAYYLIRQRGIRNVLILGVHLNMCVLGRPFGIRQLVAQGLNVALVRDLTDTMYNSRRRPYVSHFVGTDLMVEHVEKHWCPSITSADLLGGEPFRFQADRRPNIIFLIGENEYHTWETLPAFAREVLAWRGFKLDFVTSSPRVDDYHWENWRSLAKADLIVVSVRRRAVPWGMLDLLRQRLQAGAGLVGIRTASHAFALRGRAAEILEKDTSLVQWAAFDPEVLGGNYHNHHPAGPLTILRRAPGAEAHPVLTGVDPGAFVGHGSLYKVSPLSRDATPLLLGRIPDQPEEPVAWVRRYGPNQAKVFYTSLGHPDDFEQAGFRRLLFNAMLWAMDQRIPPEMVPPPQ